MDSLPDGFPVPDNGRVALIGDTHANIWWTTKIIENLALDGIRVAVQLGDFGWWPSRREFALKVSDRAQSCRVEFLFIDGNHEHHTDLRSCALEHDPDGKLSRPVQLEPNLWYIPRGFSWGWGGVRFTGLGGAYSIDCDYRVLGFDHFKQETPTRQEIERAVNTGSADVLLTHDHPDLGYRLHGSPGLAAHHELASQKVRQDLAKVVRALTPEVVVHGHWHRRYTRQCGSVRVEGLDCDGTAGGVVVLDLETLKTDNWTSPTRMPSRSTVGH